MGKIKSIPDNKSLRKWNLKANQFEIGLSQFVNKVLKQSFMSFRDEYDRAQNIKKGAAAKLLNSVMLK